MRKGDEKNFKLVGGPKKYLKKRVRIAPYFPETKPPRQKTRIKWLAELVEQLKLARLARRLTQYQLAKELKTTQPFISNFENLRTNPTAEFLEAVAWVLKVEITVKVEKRV